ncbi:uncharacterized protein F4807DRAFT_458784 [Annulohypoxylon truncatum]|uniref:uncharacterized protein n=1 Tax=Annulohypoxylon truncatum TaxID=327061 RepID=UPI0020080E85|nr:uncharacterized protein F4807DRAFT_458784 [Annulohypoxylon truncatum]KAI1211212.1 hypothetical protein F4807DRAFT_458784 [Annulohypoxylon truncatum]
MELNYVRPNPPNEVFRLLDLPTEVVLELCDTFLPGNGPYLTFKDHEEAVEGFSDLARLACTCKALSRIVRSFFHNRREHRQFIGIIPYTRNILQSPELALRETTFRMVPSQTIGSLEVDDIELFEIVSRALEGHSLGISFLSLMLNRNIENLNLPIFYGKRGDLACLLLLNLPNLTSMSIDCFPEYPFSLLQHNPLKLHSLKRARFIGVRIRPGEYSNGVNIHDLRDYYDAAPNLEVLEFERMEACRLETRLRHVHSLSLIDCYLGVDDVDRLLGNRDGMPIERFTYITGLHGNYLRKKAAAQGQEMLPNNLVKSLKHSNSRNRLETLKVDLRERGDFSTSLEAVKTLDWWYHFHEHDAVSHFMTTLKFFPSLRHVTLTQQCLWEPYYNWADGFEKDTSLRNPTRLIHLLPETIESFTLVDVTVEFIPAIISLAAVVNSKLRFPNLNRVGLRPHPDLIRQHSHAKAHADDPSLPRGISNDMRCIVDSYLEPYRAMIIRLFQYAGVEVEFPLEVYPIHTRDEKDLERQRRLGHWCRECHFHGDTLREVSLDNVGEEGGCVSAHK